MIDAQYDGKGVLCNRRVSKGIPRTSWKEATRAVHRYVPFTIWAKISNLLFALYFSASSFIFCAAWIRYVSQSLSEIV